MRDEVMARIAESERVQQLAFELRVQKEVKARAEPIRAAAKKESEAALAPKLHELEKAKVAAEKKAEALATNQEKEVAKRVKEARQALEKDKDKAVNAEKARYSRSNLRLQAKVQELQRQLDKKTADELGEGAQVDLFETLRSAFPDDRIMQVKAGEEGGDLIQTVVYNEQPCGTIIYDSKNRKRWFNDYATKLRRDQLAAEADHAILTTQKFPEGAQQLHIQDGVIVTNPARVVVLAQILREDLIRNHGLRISTQARDEKKGRLYAFITSEKCHQLFDQINTQADDILDIDVNEQNAHKRVWERRGTLVKSIQRAHGELWGEIERVIGTGPDGALAVL